MANLAINRLDSTEAAAAVVACIRDEIPGAQVTTEVSGTVTAPSFRQAFGHELAGYFRSKESVVLAVQATCAQPRPLEVQVRYVQVGRGGGPLSVLALTRLRIAVPGRAVLRRTGSWPRMRVVVDGDDAVRDPLAAAQPLHKGISGLLREMVVIGRTTYTIDPFVELIPDPDGALFAVFNTPARPKLGLSGFGLGLRSFLELTDGVERTLAPVPGVEPAPRPEAALPGSGGA